MSDEGAHDDIRSLWQGDAPEEVYHVSLHELRQVSRRRSRRIRLIAGLLVAVFAYGVVSFSWIAWTARQPLERIGALLQLPAMVFLAYQVIALARGMGLLDSAMQAEPSVSFYRASLERLRDHGSGVWLWSRVAVYFPAALVYTWGVALGHRSEGWSAYLAFAIVVAALLVYIPLTVLPGTRPLLQELAALDRATREG